MWAALLVVEAGGEVFVVVEEDDVDVDVAERGNDNEILVDVTRLQKR